MSVEKTVCTIDYFSGRCSASRFLKGGTDTCNGHSDRSSSGSRFSYKLQKISIRTMSECTIFAHQNQLNRNDTDPSTRGKRVPGSTGKFISFHKGTKPINWSLCINSNCSSARTSAVLSHVVTTKFRTAGTRRLQLKNNFACGSERRARLVGEKYSFHQEKMNNFCISQLKIASNAYLKRWEAFFP